MQEIWKWGLVINKTKHISFDLAENVSSEFNPKAKRIKWHRKTEWLVKNSSYLKVVIYKLSFKKFYITLTMCRTTHTLLE